MLQLVPFFEKEMGSDLSLDAEIWTFLLFGAEWPVL